MKVKKAVSGGGPVPHQAAARTLPFGGRDITSFVADYLTTHHPKYAPGHADLKTTAQNDASLALNACILVAAGKFQQYGMAPAKILVSIPET